MKHIIFDFGQVMVRFDPAYMVGRYVRDPADAALLERVLFDRLYWDRLDDGTMSDAQVVEACRTRIPERLWAVAEQIHYDWIYNIPEIEGMYDLVAELKTRGVRLFLLSNISKYFAAHAHEIPCLALFEQCFYSAVCGRIKPTADAFLHVCNTCGIAPGDTLFVDDSPKNIAGAEACGLQSYLFDGNAKALRRYLQEQGVL